MLLCVAAGTLSPEWAGNDTVTRAVYLGNNRLTGSIPGSWAGLVANAYQVDLSNNRLWGALDPSWYNATKDPSVTWSLNFTRLRSVTGAGVLACPPVLLAARSWAWSMHYRQLCDPVAQHRCTTITFLAAHVHAPCVSSHRVTCPGGVWLLYAAATLACVEELQDGSHQSL